MEVKKTLLGLSVYFYAVIIRNSGFLIVEYHREKIEMTSAFKYSARFVGDIPKVKPNLATSVLMFNCISTIFFFYSYLTVSRAGSMGGVWGGVTPPPRIEFGDLLGKVRFLVGKIMLRNFILNAV